jgi:hypothetical protein
MADRYFSERQSADDCRGILRMLQPRLAQSQSRRQGRWRIRNQRNFSIETKLIENAHFFSLRYGVLLYEPDKEHSFCFEETLVNVLGQKTGHSYRYAGRFLVFSRRVLPE